ncbi:sugar ABC transporter ATP-binding protein, partial [Nocardiopsis tropica]|nr:sugar ABC transporter ATP-binding protein [Nocardiopsis tropica]
MDPTEVPPPLALVDVTKSFGSVRALRGLSLELRPGEIHALVGENGAGKSTLVKTIAGVHRPDSGQLLVDGVPTAFGAPADAQRAGVAVIHQEPTLFPDLSVAENIFVGRQPLTRLRTIDRKRMRSDTGEAFARLGVGMDPDRPARGLSIADQQLVEIAKALTRRARVLVMDEPTAALSGVEAERLFTVARTLRDSGAALLFISHRFDEVFALCDRITVVRDGAFVSCDPTPDLDVDTVVRRMVGRDVTSLYPKEDAERGDTVLEVDGLTRRGVFADVSFRVRAGEIVALAGLVGAGRSEVVR